jgi:hypothetical protein
MVAFGGGGGGKIFLKTYYIYGMPPVLIITDKVRSF